MHYERHWGTSIMRHESFISVGSLLRTKQSGQTPRRQIYLVLEKCVTPQEQEHAQTSCLQNNFFATTFEPDTEKIAASVDDG
jgi:hypothetical protein